MTGREHGQDACTCNGDRCGSPHKHAKSCPLRGPDIAGWDYPPPVDDLDAYTATSVRTGNWSWRTPGG